MLAPGAGVLNLLIAAALVFLVLPYNHLLRKRVEPAGRAPGAMAWADQLIAAASSWPGRTCTARRWSPG